VGYVCLAQNRVEYIAFVNTIMNLVSVTGEKFIEQLCRMNLVCGIS